MRQLGVGEAGEGVEKNSTTSRSLHLSFEACLAKAPDQILHLATGRIIPCWYAGSDEERGAVAALVECDIPGIRGMRSVVVSPNQYAISQTNDMSFAERVLETLEKSDHIRFTAASAADLERRCRKPIAIKPGAITGTHHTLGAYASTHTYPMRRAS